MLRGRAAAGRPARSRAAGGARRGHASGARRRSRRGRRRSRRRRSGPGPRTSASPGSRSPATGASTGGSRSAVHVASSPTGRSAATRRSKRPATGSGDRGCGPGCSGTPRVRPDRDLDRSHGTTDAGPSPAGIGSSARFVSRSATRTRPFRQCDPARDLVRPRPPVATRRHRELALVGFPPCGREHLPVDRGAVAGSSARRPPFARRRGPCPARAGCTRAPSRRRPRGSVRPDASPGPPGVRSRSTPKARRRCSRAPISGSTSTSIAPSGDARRRIRSPTIRPA